MEEIVKVIVISLVSVILSLLLSDKAPVFSVCIILAVSFYSLSISLSMLEVVLQSTYSLIESSGISTEIFEPVIKVCFIAIVVKISGDICKDAGHSAVAQKINFMGSIASILTVFPLFNQIIAILRDII